MVNCFGEFSSLLRQKNIIMTTPVGLGWGKGAGVGGAGRLVKKVSSVF